MGVLKVAEKGRDFVDIEMKRMNKLLDSDAKMAPAKKARITRFCMDGWEPWIADINSGLLSQKFWSTDQS